jgi:hypothetical protein
MARTSTRTTDQGGRGSLAPLTSTLTNRAHPLSEGCPKLDYSQHRDNLPPPAFRRVEKEKHRSKRLSALPSWPDDH